MFRPGCNLKRLINLQLVLGKVSRSLKIIKRRPSLQGERKVDKQLIKARQGRIAGAFIILISNYGSKTKKIN